jgi:RimJ/RimL family protein N-acetyltransferase
MYESLSKEALRWMLSPCTREHIENWWLKSLQNLLAMVVLHDDKIVGHAQIYKYPHPRRKGAGDLLICLHQDFHRVGLGTAMLNTLIQAVGKEGLHRISSSVIADSERAIRLYEKLGFRREGTMQDSYLGEDGRYHDELVMGLIFS